LDGDESGQTPLQEMIDDETLCQNSPLDIRTKKAVNATLFPGVSVLEMNGQITAWDTRSLQIKNTST
jgi:hypothetical protein